MLSPRFDEDNITFHTPVFSKALGAFSPHPGNLILWSVLA